MACTATIRHILSINFLLIFTYLYIRLMNDILELDTHCQIRSQFPVKGTDVFYSLFRVKTACAKKISLLCQKMMNELCCFALLLLMCPNSCEKGMLPTTHVSLGTPSEFNLKKISPTHTTV